MVGLRRTNNYTAWGAQSKLYPICHTSTVTHTSSLPCAQFQFSSADVHTNPDHGHLDLFLEGQCHKMDFDGYFFEGLNFLICAEGFQGLSKVFRIKLLTFICFLEITY